MVLQETEVMVQTALSDTILMTCRKSLPYENEFSIEGMLHIVLDKKEVILINIKDTVQKGDEVPSEEEKVVPDVEEKYTDPSVQKDAPRSRKGRKPKRKIDVDIESNDADSKTRRSPRSRSKKLQVCYFDSDEDNEGEEESGISDLSKAFPNVHSQLAESGGDPVIKQEQPDETDATKDEHSEELQNIARKMADQLSSPEPGASSAEQASTHPEELIADSRISSLRKSGAHSGLGQPESHTMRDSDIRVQSGVNCNQVSTMRDSDITVQSGVNCNQVSTMRDGSTMQSGVSLENKSCSIVSHIKKNIKSTQKHTRNKTSHLNRKKKGYLDIAGSVSQVVCHPRKNKYTLMCDICGKWFRMPCELKYHMYIHTGEMPHKCKFCKKRFLSEEEMEAHSNKHKMHPCGICGREFRIRRDLQYHINSSHTGEKPYICSFCGKGFSREVNMTVHERMHTGEKPFKCSFCEATYFYSKDLKAHERTHTGEKPYKCQFCGKTFAWRRALINHERIHTGEKPYRCEYCDKAFAVSGNLTQHTRTHTGEKPYKCDECEAAYITSSLLKAHKKGHSKQKEQGSLTQTVDNVQISPSFLS